MPEHGVAVAAGGAVGSLARTGVGLALPGVLGTLLVNVTGAFLLGLLLARTTDPRRRALLGTGVLGSWTTFSALVVDTDRLLRSSPALALGYLGVSLGAGLLAARAGRQVPA